MEEDDIQTPSKYSRVNNSNGGGGGGRSIACSKVIENKTDFIMPTIAAINNNSGDLVGNRLRQWPHSSRIIRVSRASGGKDRHSKVWTAKGPRDRRVRLSVSTAIQFYDLQDRLGYDQPSKAVEWLIKAANDAINELPSLNNANFPPETPRQPSDEPRAGNVLDCGDAEMDGEVGLGQNQKSGCSSNNSETSKGSGLSLSRSEIRVKARERARERTAKEKEKDYEPQQHEQLNHHHHQQQQQQQNVNSITPTSSFTQLLTAGINNLKYENSGGGGGSSSHSPRNQWLTSPSTTPMDYIGGSVGLITSNTNTNPSRGGYTPGQIHVGGGSLMTISSFNELHNHHHQHQQHQQHFPFVTDQQQQQMLQSGGGGTTGNDYNLNFTISSTTTGSSGGHIGAGYNNNNRGPLQSNSSASSSLLPYHLQRYTNTDGTSVPFFLGGAAVENQQFHHPSGLQLCYGDNNNNNNNNNNTNRQSDHKGKGKK